MKKYQKYNVEATEDRVKESIKDNTYDRANSIKSFIEGLDMIEDNVFISLDAKWGQGKTFYVRQIEMTLKYLSKKKFEQDVSDLEDVFAKSILKNVALEKTYLPIYYNSWLYDNHNDPLMSLLYVIIKECEKYVSTTIDTKTLGDKLLSLLSPFSIALPFLQISGDMEKIKENFVGKDLLQEIKTAEEIRHIVKQILNEVIVESAQKLVVFIDELDRCKPSYAIEMLERIKHYFDDERLVFVASVNKEQLVHIISNYYGDAFDATGYLNKFFDINIYLPEIPKYLRENSILKTNNEQYFVRRIVEELIEYYNLSLRDTIIYQQNMEATSKQYYSDTFAQGCMVSIFVPVIQILDLVDQSMKKNFMEGKGSIFAELCENIPSIHRMICRFGNNGSDDDENYRVGYEKISKVYDCIFKANKPYDGTLDISRDLRDICIRVCNGE